MCGIIGGSSFIGFLPRVERGSERIKQYVITKKKVKTMEEYMHWDFLNNIHFIIYLFLVVRFHPEPKLIFCDFMNVWGTETFII